VLSTAAQFGRFRQNRRITPNLGNGVSRPLPRIRGDPLPTIQSNQLRCLGEIGGGRAQVRVAPCPLGHRRGGPQFRDNWIIRGASEEPAGETCHICPGTRAQVVIAAVIWSSVFVFGCAAGWLRNARGSAPTAPRITARIRSARPRGTASPRDAACLSCFVLVPEPNHPCA
jgi:hypothetical protein